MATPFFTFNELFFEVECGRLKRNCEKINKYYWTCRLEILITSSCVAFLSRKSWKVVSVKASGLERGGQLERVLAKTKIAFTSRKGRLK